jgi:hypothetical protein
MFYLKYRTGSGEFTKEKPALDEIRNYEKLLSQLAGFEILGAYEDSRPLDPTEGAEWGPVKKGRGSRPLSQQRAPQQEAEAEKRYKMKPAAAPGIKAEKTKWGAPPKRTSGDIQNW